jgi:hypothetical protein
MNYQVLGDPSEMGMNEYKCGFVPEYVKQRERESKELSEGTK